MESRDINVQAQLKLLKEIQAEAKLEESILLEKAIMSDDASDIMAASLELQKRNHNKKSKTYFLDPMSLTTNLGFKDKPVQVSYGILRGMAKSPIAKAVISTRIEQVSNFSEAQDNSSRIGWSIRKKKRLFAPQDEQELTDEDKFEIEKIINFLDRCGEDEEKRYFENSDFGAFLKRFTKDSLELDQATFEVVRNRMGKPIEFFNTDGATHRLADSYMNILSNGVKKDDLLINGQYPFYVQIYQGAVKNEYYPWELCFGIRNVSTNIHNFGYGCSELEDMIKIVTWMLHSDQYNGNFFSNGSNTRGIFVMKSADPDKMSDFRNQWRQQVAGVQNSWKTPILEGEEVNWINMQMSNNDMQFQQWQEYLIRLFCALYRIAPEEIGFHINSSGGGINYEGNQEYKLEYSQAKGLFPLLKFIAKRINQFLVYPYSNDKYEFYWTGIVDEDEEKELANDITKVTNFMGYKEMRKKHNLPAELEEGDFPLNPVYLQFLQMKMNGADGNNQAVNNMLDNGQNPFLLNNIQNSTPNGKDNPFVAKPKEKAEDNPFMKDLNSFLEKALK